MEDESKSVAKMPGSHLNNADDEPSPAESIVKVISRFAFKSFAWVSIYLLGYYNFSVAWLFTPLILTVLRSQWKKERDAKLSAAREAALTNEKHMIESRIRERAEWINSIIHQLWPNVGHYTRKLISESIEPSVRQALEGYGFSGFKFERVVLGQIPPRITGIKVYYKNVNRNEIIMDMDLVFASDCDIKFSVGRIKAKLMDFSLRGLLRVVFKPIVNEMPLIGGIQAYFLVPPEIDFDLGGIANAFDAPGLSNIIRQIVLEQIGFFMVLPHKYTMPLIESVENKILKCPDSAGVLRVRLHKAVQLAKKDVGVLGMGKSDPYAVLTVGARSVKTNRINNTVNPEWDYVADFPIEVVSGQQLTLEIFDHDDPGDDEFLGRATVQTSVVAKKGHIQEMWVELEDADTGRALMSLSWLEASSDIKQLERPHLPEEKDLTKCLLHVYVDCCKELPSKSPAHKPCPMVELKVGQTVHTTFPQYYTNDPVFEQGFVFMIVNPDADDLHVRVLDTRKDKDNVLCTAVIRNSNILKEPGMEFPNQPFHLKGGIGNSQIVLAAQIRPLKAAGKSTKPIDPPKDSKDEVETKTSLPTALESDSTPSAKKDEKLINLDESDDPKPAERPSVDSPLAAMIANTVTPMVESTASEETKEEVNEMLEPINELRRRGPQASMSATGCGKVRVSLIYDQGSEKLKFVIHQAAGLPGSDLPDPPDPYVKVYLLPERSRKSKRKTEVCKDSCNPEYEESFEYEIPLGKLGLSAL
ncbi:hypothetical protein TCAL_08980 [Tigriopus californicus]|uniref:Extended synaptotagmin-2 n=1 Tax=Tigriopus californicus TaxID=6832 RepID=A0A553PL42_TIGCA|nr:hypothetical protein TCAL_08980 [Tigriopus californicus]|eukprot:TCALIF_08980-PA protein Name:"Similar to Esyt2 Extended synaptotagmin-2 (Mus musculus)" AED:0.05 eAED:0.07 QI:0/0/0.5/1/1/1/2/335/755